MHSNMPTDALQHGHAMKLPHDLDRGSHGDILPQGAELQQPAIERARGDARLHDLPPRAMHGGSDQ